MTTVLELQDLHQQRKDEYRRQVGLRDAAHGLVESLTKSLDLEDNKVACYRKASAVFQGLSDEETKHFHADMKTLVTAGLQAVFEEEMTFDIDFKVERNVLTTRFLVGSNVGGTFCKFDILSAKGGGVADVVSFLLQFLMVYYLSDRRKLIIADEPFKNLSRSYKRRFAEFVKMICEKAGMQIIMVTHEEEYVDVADRVYRFSLDGNGFTNVNSVT